MKLDLHPTLKAEVLDALRRDFFFSLSLTNDAQMRVASAVADALEAATNFALIEAALGADARNGCAHDSAICRDCRVTWAVAALKKALAP